MSSLFQNIIILLGIVLVGIFGYYLYIENSRLDVGDSAAISNQIAIETSDFLVLLNELKAMELGGELFADPRFISFMQLSPLVQPQPIGKGNPFAVN